MTTKMAVVAGQNSEQLSNNFEVGPKFFGLICNCLNCNYHCQEHIFIFYKNCISAVHIQKKNIYIYIYILTSDYQARCLTHWQSPLFSNYIVLFVFLLAQFSLRKTENPSITTAYHEEYQHKAFHVEFKHSSQNGLFYSNKQ